MATHKDLDAWKESIVFVTDIYRATSSFPKDELYGLISQMRRAAVSIPSNIAEGAARNHTPEFIQFLYISLGSLSEVETQLNISCNLKYLSDAELKTFFLKIKLIRTQLSGLIKYLRARNDITT